MKDIFEFNHIDKSLTESDVTTLKDFYSHYHKKYWCFKQSYKSYKFLDNFFTISGICLVAIGTISGGITLNPVVLGVVNGAGVIVAGVGKKNNYKRKIEMSRIAFTTYDKVLVELRAALRGDEWNKQEFVDRMKLIDELIIDQTPIADRFESRYNEKFNININIKIRCFSQSDEILYSDYLVFFYYEMLLCNNHKEYARQPYTYVKVC